MDKLLDASSATIFDLNCVIVAIAFVATGRSGHQGCIIGIWKQLLLLVIT